MVIILNQAFSLRAYLYNNKAYNYHYHFMQINSNVTTRRDI